ncbi:tight junction protein ZO-1 isoform X5 [Atheta coriaria]
MQTKRSVKLKQAEGKNRFKETISTKSRARRKEVFNVNADYASAVYAAKHSSKKSGGKKERGWEFKQITVTRVPGYGFGIAVSGGRDNPHFASGDPSIAVSDVLASGPAERMLQVNDRIISVNGISLQNVDYATAVQVLRDSGDTVVLVIKRRNSHHQHQHSLSASYTSAPLAALGLSPPKVTLTKNSKKEDFGIVLGCKLFVKEISTKAREQLMNTNQLLNEGDFITKINNTSCNDLMSLKEAKKIIDSTKDKLHLSIARDFVPPSNLSSNISHQAQSSVSTTGAVNNFYKGDDFLTSGTSYSNQNLYVQPPTRNPNLNTNGFDHDKVEASGSAEDKSNLVPRSRRGGEPPPHAQHGQHTPENRNSIYGRSKGPVDEPPRPPPPRAEDYYSSRRQLYEDDPIIQKSKQPIPDARFITFHKEGSVGIRLTGGNYVGIFVTAVQPGSPASLQGLQPGDKILKVNDMDMTGVTREEAVLYLLSLQDRIELIVQYCKEEYDNIVASQKGDSFYIKTHFHYDTPAKGEMSFRSGDIFRVIDTLYNGVVGCWQVYRIGRNHQEVQKGIIPNKARAEELATAQFNATKKEMSANESRGSFFRRRRSSNRRSKSLGKEHWDDILFSDTVSKFPAYERVILKHPGFTRPVILFGPIADVARDKLIKDFPDKFISPQLDSTVEDGSKGNKLSSNIIKLSAIREVISTGKHALLDITPNAVERLNYAQLYPIVVFFKADTKIVVKQLRQGLPKSAHKSSKKLLEQCQKLDKVWSHIFSANIALNDNTETWYRKVREIIDKQQSGALWMSESKLLGSYLYPRFKTYSLPSQYRSAHSGSKRRHKAPLSMYDSPQGRSKFYHVDNGSYCYHSPSQSSLYSCSSYQQSLHPNQSQYQPYPEECLSDDFLFPMSSLRLSYASSPESDLEHSPGPPLSSSHATNGPGGGGGRLTKASSDPSVVMADNSTTDVLPPYQPTYDSRYGFNGQSNQDPPTPTSPTKEQSFLSPNSSDHVNNNSSEPSYTKPPGIMAYNHSSSQSFDAKQHHHGMDYNDISKNVAHKRQSSNLHYKGHSMSEATLKDAQNIYGGAPDLPPRVDRAVKPPPNVQTTPSKQNGRSAHERLFGTKAPADGEPIDAFGQKLGSLDRSQNSKSDSLSSYDSFNNPKHRIIPNAHDDLKTTLSKIDSGVPGSPSKYNRWEGSAPNHRHDRLGSKLDLKYSQQNLNGDSGLSMGIDSPRNSREMDVGPLDQQISRTPERHDMYRYNRSPAKQSMPQKQHIETKTDYGKYSRNNGPPEYTRTSHQDLSQSHLSIHQPLQQSPMKNPHQGHGPAQQGQQQIMNGQFAAENGTNGNANPNSYKPIPPPKPKNYKPPYKNSPNNFNDGPMQQMHYQHNKSHSNPVDQRLPMNSTNHNYYYNMPQSQGQQGNAGWHTETAVRYNANIHGHYDMAPAYERRHPSISYASRSEIAPIAQQEMSYGGGMGMDIHQGDILDTRSPDRHNIVDLQGSREQRGSAFELYRKPVHHNLR